MNIKTFLTAPAEEQSLYGTIFSIFIMYCLLVFLLAKLTLIDQKDLIQVITIFVGWIITLLLAVIHCVQPRRKIAKGELTK